MNDPTILRAAGPPQALDRRGSFAQVLKRKNLVRTIQGLSKEEGTRQPNAADWLRHCDQSSSKHPFLSEETTVADDPKKTGLDRKLLTLNEPHEVRSWTEWLGVDEKTLKAAVAAVGSSVEKVREYLKKK